MPPLHQQARNFIVAGARTARAILRGQPVTVPPEILQDREEICAGCEENISGRCRKCGCGVRAQLLRKTHLAAEECPLNPPKWTAYISPLTLTPQK